MIGRTRHMERKILVRFDDICPTMDWTQWDKAVSILEQFQIKPLLGVIPNCLDTELQIDPPREDFWQYLLRLQKKGYVLAMHGSEHLYDSCQRGLVNMGRVSEFAGHSYEVQKAKIQKGKEILESHGIYTDIFFAPSHSYDKNTLRALAVNGFRYVSDGMSEKPFVREGVICLPCRSSGVPRIKGNGYYTAVFHAHEWVRPDKAVGYEALKSLCRDYTAEIVDFDTYRDQPMGNPHVQSVIEKIFLVWRRKIKPVASKIKWKIKGSK